jgi:hypothetical protein
MFTGRSGSLRGRYMLLSMITMLVIFSAACTVKRVVIEDFDLGRNVSNLSTNIPRMPTKAY